jgi:hypothetical protein
MSNYSAIVVKIDNIRKHENADRLQCTNIYGNNIIVGLDTKVGDVGLYFPLESQIGEEFAVANDLIRRKDENGKPAGGMFDANRRVRAQTLRGEKSMGFFCPAGYLFNLLNDAEYVDEIHIPAIGTEIETWKGFDIAKKYVVPTKQQNGGSKQGNKAKKESRVMPEQWHFHFDTAQLGRNLDKIHPDSLISITWKTHGTSGICGHVLTKKKLKWYEKALKKIGVDVVDSEYDYIYSSRRVIKNDDKEYNHFYSEDIWSIAGEQFKNKLHKGETVYFEILGYTSDGGYIQKDYDYGCKKGEHALQIYRITQTNVDGVVTELPWHQVVHRAKEIGIPTVPEIWYGKAVNAFNSEWWSEAGSFDMDIWQKDFLTFLSENYVYDQDSIFCKNKVPEEGVVVRVENGDGIENFKLKAFRFLQHESKMLDKGESDMETEQSENE